MIRLLKLGCACFVVVIIVCMLIAATVGIPEPARDGAPPATARQAPTPSRHPLSGENCYLNSGSSVVLLPKDEATSKEMYSFARAKNNEALAQLALAGRMLVLPKNSKAVVLETGIMTYRVRVTEGDGAGREGIIATEYVHSAPQ